jgi:pyruvate formate lyase activating enzyme
MRVKAVVRSSLIEYPGHIADVFFAGGCNFRCVYCYNRDLVLNHESLPDLPQDQLFAPTSERGRFVDGVVISGGEPTLQSGLVELLARAREHHLCVKLDTNGYRPDVLRQCLESRLVDYVAMDVKTNWQRYSELTQVDVDVQRLQESVELILSSGIDHEFRTTVVPGLVGIDEVEEIAAAIRGARRYYLQAFQAVPTVGWGDSPPVSIPDGILIQRMMIAAAEMVQEVGARGLLEGSSMVSSGEGLD